MRRAAIVGTGIAGMSIAYFLRKRGIEVTVYEKNSYIGGHTNTVVVEEPQPIGIDTGFMVYNEVTYPLLTRLFSELGVVTNETDMSFGVRHEASGLEFCGTGLNGLFAQRSNLFRPAYYRFLLEIDRFNKTCVEVLDDETLQGLTLKDYLKLRDYSEAFADRYLVPMSSAVWSTPPDLMMRFPAVTLIRFFKNHGFLGLNTQHQWRTVTGGTRNYRDKLISSFRDRIFVNRGAVSVRNEGRLAFVKDSSGKEESYDEVILACHADEALELLADPTPDEKRLLSKFGYQPNLAILHTDPAVMPRSKKVWSSWNYIVPQAPNLPYTVYYMNRLQGVSKKTDYFISIHSPQDGSNRIRKDRILKEISYTHPLFSLEALSAQRELHVLSSKGPRRYCGSYFRYGFHEDALLSSVQLFDQLFPGASPWNP